MEQGIEELAETPEGIRTDGPTTCTRKRRAREINEGEALLLDMDGASPKAAKRKSVERCEDIAQRQLTFEDDMRAAKVTKRLLRNLKR